MKSTTPGLSGRQYVFAALLGALLIGGCATTPTVVRPTKYPSSAKDWHGIDSIEFLQELRLEDYSRLIMEPLNISATKLPPKDENTYAAAIRILNRADSIVLIEIQDRVKGNLEVSNAKPESRSLEKTLLLRGKVTEIDPGSRAARYWIGFGAGRAWVTISGEIVDAKTDKVLLSFEQRRLAVIGVFGGAYDGMLTDCVVEIGRDIGHMLVLFKSPETKK